MSDTEVLPGSQGSAPEPAPATPAGEGAAPPRSLRETLSAAFAEDAAKQGPGEGEAAGAQARPAPAAEGAKPAKTSPDRNELGQFVKQEHVKDEPTPAVEPRAGAPKAPPGGAEAPKPEAIAPAAWSPAAKAAFTQLPEVVQKEVLKREQDWNAGTAQRNQESERLNRLHEVLTPYSERFRLAGINEAQAVQQLLAASDYLERDPVNALIYLARTKGVDPRQLAQVFTGSGGQQPQPSPEYQALYGEVQTLRQHLQQQQSAATNAQYQQMLSQVESFAKDPSHTYFENVREQMADIVQAHPQLTLDQAYEQATWAHPEIRPLLLQQKAEADARAAAEAAKARSEQARRASGSITGSPSPGVTPGAPGGPKRSLREELQANWSEIA